MSPTRYAREFQDFLLKSNMFALAMGVILGNAVGKVVGSIVDGLLMPVVGVLVPSGQWRQLGPTIFGSKFQIGLFLGAVVDFVLIGALVFLLTKLFIRQQAPPPMKGCPRCKESILAEATRCRFCTSEVGG